MVLNVSRKDDLSLENFIKLVDILRSIEKIATHGPIPGNQSVLNYDVMVFIKNLQLELKVEFIYKEELTAQSIELLTCITLAETDCPDFLHKLTEIAKLGFF